MKDILYIAFGSGLRDGINPCVLMTGAIFMAQGLLFARRSMFWPRALFVFFYGLSFLWFNFGQLQIYVYQKNFLVIAKEVYAFLSLVTFLGGIIFLKDWFDGLKRNGQFVVPGENKISGFIVYPTTVAMALGLSAMSVLWPVDKYIIVLGNESMIRGQWREVLPMLMVYSYSTIWVVWLLWAFLSIKKLRVSTLKIIASAIFFSASTCIMFIFRN